MKKQQKIKLSVVIVNFNTRELLKQCLASLPKREDYQIIVVDNASTDGSVAMVKKEFEWVELVESPTNDGFTKNNNKAKGKAVGEYILFLNSDTKAFDGTLEKSVKFLDENLEAGIVTCLTVLPDGSLYYACHRGFPTPWNSLCYFSGLAKIFPKIKLFSGYTATYLPIDKTHEIDACSGTFLMIRRKILEEINWFDEEYYSYGEDIEMCFRTKELGYKVMFLPTVKLMHYWGASSGLKSTSRDVTTAEKENSDRWNKARYQAMKIFYDKHYRKRYPEIFRFIIFGAIKAINYLRKGKD